MRTRQFLDNLRQSDEIPDLDDERRMLLKLNRVA